MDLQIEALYTRNIDFLRALGTLAMTGSEQLVRQQLDSTQFMISRSSRQLKSALSEAVAAQTPEEWSRVMQESTAGALEMFRDCLVAVSDCQAETFRLMQQQATAVEELLADSFASAEVSPASEKRSFRSGKEPSRLAA